MSACCVVGCVLCVVCRTVCCQVLLNAVLSSDVPIIGAVCGTGGSCVCVVCKVLVSVVCCKVDACLRNE